MIHANHRALQSMLFLAFSHGLLGCAAEYAVEDDREFEATEEASLAAMIDGVLGDAVGSPVHEGSTCNMVDDYAPPCTGSGAHDTAFFWTAPATGTYTFTTAGSNFDTVLSLYAGIGGGGSSLGCNDDANGTLQSALSLTRSAGQIVTIVVDGYGSACGSFKLNISRTSPPTSGLGLWLRADAGVSTSSGRVTNWADQSGNNNTAFMSLTPRQPTLVPNAQNGKPVIRFGGAQSLSLTNPIKPKSFTVFIAGKNSQPSETFSMILGPGGNNANNQLRWENGSQALFVGTGNNLPIITSSIGNTRVYHALSASYDGSKMNVYRDGNLISTHSFNTTTTWDLNQIGAYYSSYFMVGDIAEILFYTAALSDADRTAVNNYLQLKYALPPPCPPVCNSPPSDCYQSTGSCASGQCVYAPKPAGASCNDGYSCTNADTCDGAGSCIGVDTCPAGSACTGNGCIDWNSCAAYGDYEDCGGGLCCVSGTNCSLCI